MSEALHFNKIAAAMLRRGIPVIPVKARDKVPIPVAWQTKASIRPNDILQWIAQYGNEINCGAVATLDGQWMLDADNPGLWNLIESETGHKLPRTFTTASRKGQHKYWKQTPASRAMDNRKSHTPPYEFDAQVDRKQVIAPGSTHPSGFVYQIVDDCDIVEAPDWLCEWVAGHGDKDKAPVTKGRISVHEDFDFEDVMNHFNISGRWDDSWFITDECPISGYKHEQSTRTGFYYDGDTFGFHCFAGGCRGSEMSVGHVIAFLNAKNIKEGEAPYKGVIWSSDDDLLVGVDDLDLTEDMIEATFENHSGREDNPGVVDGKLLPIEERLQRMAPAAPPELETPAIIVMPKVTLEMPDDCMYGELGILAKECKTPLGLTYPSLITCYSAKVKADFMCGIRVNIYGGLIAPPESGKNVTIDRSIEILELARGYDYRKAAPAGDTQLAIILGDEASGKRGSKERKPGPTRMLLVNNEMTDVLKKTGVENSTLASKLCDLWDDPYFEKIVAKDKVTVNCRLSWLGGIPAGEDDTARFSQLFGSETNFGLYPRFIFGYTNKGFNYRPWTRATMSSQTVSLDYTDGMVPNLDPLTNTIMHVESISPDADQLHQDWNPVCEHPGRIKYNCLKVAIITASANRENVVTVDCMATAIKFMEWQLRLRKVFETGHSLNQGAECRDVILKTLKAKGAEREFVSWRRVSHDHKWGEKYNDWLVKTTIENLVEAGELVYQKMMSKDGDETEAGENKKRVILNPAFTGSEEGRRALKTVVTKRKKSGEE